MLGSRPFVVFFSFLFLRRNEESSRCLLTWYHIFLQCPLKPFANLSFSHPLPFFQCLSPPISDVFLALFVLPLAFSHLGPGLGPAWGPEGEWQNLPLFQGHLGTSLDSLACN